FSAPQYRYHRVLPSFPHDALPIYGTTSNQDRLGAIGDMDFVGLDDDLLVIASDNLFEYSLADYESYWRGKGGSCIAVYDVGDPRSEEHTSELQSLAYIVCRLLL